MQWCRMDLQVRGRSYARAMRYAKRKGAARSMIKALHASNGFTLAACTGTIASLAEEEPPVLVGSSWV